MNWWWVNQNGENSSAEAPSVWKWFLWNHKKEFLWNFRTIKSWVKKSDPANELQFDELNLKRQREKIMDLL